MAVPWSAARYEVGMLDVEQTRPFRRLYRAFFDHAERKRRWNVTDDFAWDDVGGCAVDPELVDILEAFYATEMYLPDYTSQLLELNRSNHGLAWFLTNWCYEESKHSMAIEQWLVRSGHRTAEQMEALNDALLAETWRLPFDTSRKMMIYTLLQELATQLNYLNLAKQTAHAGDAVLQQLLRLIASDEGCHHRMFVDCVKVHLEQDRAGTLEDLAFVLQHFEMPAHDQIPNWQARGDLIVRRRIFSGRLFVTRVMLPSLHRIGVGRRELDPHMKRAA